MIKRICAVVIAVVTIIVAMSGCAPSSGETSDQSHVHSKPGELGGEHVTVTFQDNNAVLHNPLMGWEVGMRPSDIIMYGIPEDYDYVSIIAPWDELEPEEGQYQWEELDAAISICRKAGVSIQLGLYLQGSDVFGFTGLPEWLWTKYNIPFTIVNSSSFESVDRPDFPTKHPVYYNKVYQEKMSNFLKAVAGHFKDGAVDLLHVRPYGLYGEWDAGWNKFDWKGDFKLKSQTLHELVQIYLDAFKDYNLTRLSIDVPHAEGTDDFYQEYKVECAYDLAMANGWAVRSCGVGPNNNVDTLVIGQMIHEYAPYIPVSGETWFGWDPETFDTDATLETFYGLHANSITFGMWTNSADWQRDDNREMFDEALKKIGYRLLPEKIEYPRSGEAGKEVEIRSSWKNLGVGYCWRQYPAQYSIKDQKGNVVWSYIDTEFDQTTWVEGNTYEVVSKFALPEELNKKTGDYDLYLSLVDHTGKPSIALPIGEATESREYKIGSFAVRA